MNMKHCNRTTLITNKARHFSSMSRGKEYAKKKLKKKNLTFNKKNMLHVFSNVMFPNIIKTALEP